MRRPAALLPTPAEPPRLPFVMPPEVQEAESAFVVAHDRTAAIRARVERLAGDYRTAVAARNAAASRMLEGEAIDGQASPDALDGHRAATAEVERIAALVEAAGGALTRADLELRAPYERLSEVFGQVVEQRLTAARILFDEQAETLARTHREICTLTNAIGMPIARDVLVPSQVVPGRMIIASIDFDEPTQEAVARARSLLRSYENRRPIREADIRSLTANARAGEA